MGKPVCSGPREWAVAIFTVLAFAAARCDAFEREANTTLNFPQEPSITSSGFTTPGLINVNYFNPVALATPPGETNRLFIVERRGTIQVISNLATTNRTEFIKLNALVDSSNTEEGLLGMAFHPGYATNRYFFLFYTGHSNQGCGRDDIVARFQTSAGDPNSADTNTQQILIRQCDGDWNHNGGDLHFGADGYLYISLGDEGGSNDSFGNSQRIDKDFFAAIARIDVDKKAGSLAPNPHPAVITNASGEAYYAVPPDNAWVGATSFNGQAVNSNDVRTEFYAVGLRNPWRMSFDDVTGYLYCGDVGQNAYEEISIITNGGNYGWAGWEALHVGPKSFQTNNMAHDEPILEIPHSGAAQFEGNVVIGGRVSRGARFPDLYGHYIFSDAGSGNIWSLYYDGTNATQWKRLDGLVGISAFGVDPRNGDILFVNHSGSGKIRRLDASVSANIPLTISATGAFDDHANLSVEPGIVPYDLNLPFWSDNATKTRWFSLPDTNTFMTFSAEGNWAFPTGAVWIKHFDLELTNGVASSRRKIETRFLVRNSGGAYGYTYRWTQPPTNANLVAIPLDEDIAIHDGGVLRTQTWHYPGPAECMQCHTPVTGHVLGFRSAQLNRDFTYTSVTGNQITVLSDSSYFSGAVTSPDLLPNLAPPTNEAVSLTHRARSYLFANCAQCHVSGSGIQPQCNASLSNSLDDAEIVHGALIDLLGNPANRVIRPGVESNSVMLTRMSTRDANQMPPLGSTIVDTQGVELIRQWVHDLTNYLTVAQWQTNFFGSSTNADAQASADPDGDGSDNDAERLLLTDPLDEDDAWGIDDVVFTNGIPGVVFERIAGLSFQLQCNTNIADSNAWTTIEMAQNAQFYSSTTETTTVFDVTASNSIVIKYYRVIVQGP